MRMRSLLIFALVGCLAGTACSKDDDPDPGPIGTDPNNIDNPADAAKPDAGGDAAAPSDAADSAPDAAQPADLGFDFSVGTPGPLHGEWRVQSTDGSTNFADLHLRHEEGSTSVTGTFAMDEPAASGRLAGATFVENTFAGSWTVSVDGSNEQFGVSDCTSDDGQTFTCRYSATLSGAIVDAHLVRQP